MSERKWNREYDARIYQACCQHPTLTIYGKSLLDVQNVVDETGAPIPEYDTDEMACRLALSAARRNGLVQAWSIAEGPNGFSCMVLRFDGTAARNIESTPAAAMCWLLLEISQRRN
jgi:hypothetical protein